MTLKHLFKICLLILLLSQAVWATKVSKPFVAALRLGWLNNSIEIITLPDCTVSQSFPVHLDTTHLILNGNDSILIPFMCNYSRGYHQIQELSLSSKKITLWAKPLSVDPTKIMAGQHSFWVSFEHIIRSEEKLKESRAKGLVDYQHAGFEVYSKEAPHVVKNRLRLDEGEYITEWTWNADKSRIYVLSALFYSIDPKTKIETSFSVKNLHAPTYIHVIDPNKEKIIHTQDISTFIDGPFGFHLQNNKLYVTGAINPLLPIDNTEKGLLKTLHVFDEKTFKLLKTIPIDLYARKIVGAAEDNRIFILHDRNRITVINSLTDQVESILNMPAYKMFYAGYHRLFIIGAGSHLFILDTKTLKVIKEIKGDYNFVSIPS